MSAQGRKLEGHPGLFRGKRFFIFDFDGTIADTTPLHAAAFIEVLAPLGVEVDYAKIAGLRTRDAVRTLLAQTRIVLDEVEMQALVASKQATVRAMIAQSLRPLPGADAFLRAARGSVRMALVTSGSRGTVGAALKALGYADWFEPIVCSEDVVNAKPDPEGYLHALAAVGIAADHALVFEDSGAGIAAAMAAGIDVVDVTSVAWISLSEVLV